VPLLVWSFLIGCTPMWSQDVWWHLRTGQLILERGEIPRLDWFTFTSTDRPWIDLHWGFQLLVTWLHAVGGVDLLVLMKAACVAATLAIGWLAAPRLPAPARALCWLLPIICISGRAMERPELLTYVFLATTLVCLERSRPRLLWALPLVQLVWVNCHALFVLGLVGWAAMLGDRLAREALGGRFGVAPAPTEPPLRSFLLAMALCLLASFANPYLAEGALFPLTLYRKFGAEQELYAVVGEFRTPVYYVLHAGVFGSRYMVAWIALWLATAASFVWLARERRLAVGRLLLFAAFSKVALDATRNVAVFAIAAGVVLSANCGEALELRARRVPRSRPHRGLRPALSVATASLFAALAASVVSGHWVAWFGERKVFGLGERIGEYAHEAVRFAGREGMPMRAFASHFGVASLYSYYYGPEHRVFMDGRLEVASPETMLAYLEILYWMATGDTSWPKAFARDEAGQLPAVILSRASHRREIAGVLATPGWRAVYADGLAVVFIEEELAERLALPAVMR